MEASASALPWRTLYKLLIGSVVPRPIGWVSSISEQGQVNLAPFSFFNAVCANPPTLLFCPMIRSTDGGHKDTLRNVRARGEFVINIVSEDLAQAMNITATEFPSGVNEFEAAGVTPAPAAAVAPPRVAESRVHFECRVERILEFGDQPGSGSVVIGRILHVHVDESVLLDGDKIDLLALKPIGRLAGSAYTRVTDLFDLMRPPSQIKPQ